MSAPIQRRSTLRKAAVTDDVVAGLTEPVRATPPVAPVVPAQQAPTAAPEVGPEPSRRGPGRPRGRRRMEPFSSKIEISLRDEVDAYAARYGESYVDLLDRALRAAISVPPPER